MSRPRSYWKVLLAVLVACVLAAWLVFHFSAQTTLPGSKVLSDGWQLQDAAKVSQNGPEIAQTAFSGDGWYPAKVPGTVLTTLVSNGVYPEPLFGENNRPDKIPESLNRTDYWYRTVFRVPADYAHRQIWLNFSGINYAAEVWVNGQQAGTIRGAFTRGVFDITSVVKPGQDAALAVKVSPQPHPGTPFEHTIADGMVKNGGITAIDGPTFLCTIGWDWLPGIRDRNTGIWQKVFLSATGPVVIRDPLVTTDLPLPHLDSANVGIQVTVQNVTDHPRKGTLKGDFDGVSFERSVELAPHASTLVAFSPKDTPQLHVKNPKLWWPNGYGPQNLYDLHLRFEASGAVSDQREVSFGIREITYDSPGSENLILSVNGVPIFCRGGNWGLDEALKRIPRERLEAQIRMHQLANLNMIRNWVGQSTSEDFYDLCDKYGILLWDEFFQPNPGDGPNPTDLTTYIANVREKILRFRNHPSIAVWCARNEGPPPPEIDAELRKLMAELEPTRHYQPSSTDGGGVHSGGPYSWRTPREFYDAGEPFKTEIGSVSVPTLESIHGMMPTKDWEVINDDWAEHDLAAGAQRGDVYPQMIRDRYGKVANLADFVRKAQLANYEAFRALFEGRNAKLFHPFNAAIIWMSNPAQPSFVWQLYHHDLEPNSSLYAVRSSCEPVHIQMNEKDGSLQVINNLPTWLTGANAHVTVFNLDGSVASEKSIPVAAAPSHATTLGSVDEPPSFHFVKLELRGTGGTTISRNFYWRGKTGHPDDLKPLNDLPVVPLEIKVARRDSDGKSVLDVTVSNPTPQIALMAHLQLRRANSGQRVLPAYASDNYFSLAPKESRKLTIEAASADLAGEPPLIVVDGWNIAVAPTSDTSVALNEDAQVGHWPVTGLPIYYGPPMDSVRINCGGLATGQFAEEGHAHGGSIATSGNAVTAGVPNAAPPAVYQSERWGEAKYLFPMKPPAPGHTYTVRLHFAETKFDQPGQRKFNVLLNGNPILKDFDVLAKAGGPNRAVVKEFAGIVPNEEGNIVIELKKGSADNPKLNGIEILPL